MQELEIGITNEEIIKVSEELTAPRFVRGTPEAFATPALVALIELAAANALKPYLEPGETTVGTALEIKHTAPTPVGMSVRCRATVVEVDRRKVLFEIAAWDDEEQIGQGKHERFVINLGKFNDNLNRKRQ